MTKTRASFILLLLAVTTLGYSQLKVDSLGNTRVNKTLYLSGGVNNGYIWDYYSYL